MSRDASAWFGNSYFHQLLLLYSSEPVLKHNLGIVKVVWYWGGIQRKMR